MCGHRFEPSPPVYSCPRCQSNATAPLDSGRRLAYERRRAEEERRLRRAMEEAEAERTCPECGADMRLGYLVERNDPLQLLTLGEGVYWTPDEAGVIGSRVALKSYACPGCGRVSLYVRRLEADREIIMKAPKRKRQTPT